MDDTNSADFSPGADVIFSPQSNISTDTDTNTTPSSSSLSQQLHKAGSKRRYNLNDDVNTDEEPKLKKPTDYYNIVSDNSSNNVKDKIGYCKECQHKLNKSVQFKMKNGSTSGIIRHLQRFHNEVFVTTSYAKKKMNNMSGSTNSIESAFEKQRNENPGRKNIRNDYIAKFISCKFLPFNFFDDCSCKDLFKFLSGDNDLKLPGRNETRDIIKERFTYGQACIKEKLGNNDSFISFTIDAWWTNMGSRSFYGVTAHFIDENWNLQPLTLDILPSNGKHSGSEMAQMFVKLLESYNIQHKVMGITTDNASANFTFANSLQHLLPSSSFSSKNNHFFCFSHIINLAVQDFLKKLSSTFEMPSIETEECETVPINLESEVDEGILEEEECEIQILSNKEPKTISTIQKIKLLALKIKHSEILKISAREASDFNKIDFLMPTIEIKTRWGSLLKMLKWWVHMRTALNTICNNKSLNLKHLILSENEEDLVLKVISILDPFDEASISLSGEKKCTISSVILLINLLIDNIEDNICNLNKEPDNDNNKILILGLSDAKQKIMKHYQKSNWIYCVALMLHPSHRLDGFKKTSWGREMKKEACNTFIDLYKRKYKTESTTTSSTSLNNEAEASVPKNSKLTSTNQSLKNNLFNIFEQKRRNEKNNEQEIKDYFAGKGSFFDFTKDCEIKWWKDNRNTFPGLSKMAKDIFSITATSVPAERLFSRAGLTVTKTRNSLNSDSIKYLLCLKSWYEEHLI